MSPENYKQRIDITLNQVHDQVVSKIFIAKKAEEDKITAQKIESVLRTIKSIPLKAKNVVDEELLNQATEQIKTLAHLSSVFMNRKTGSNRNRIFQRSHSTKTVFGGDDIFEEELATVIAMIEFKATGQPINISSKLVGSSSANVKLKHDLEKTTQEVMTKYVSRMSKSLVEEINGKPDKHYVAPVARSGKTDVSGVSMLDISAELNPKWEELFNLFKGKTFTVKNYGDFSKRLDIHLGNTDYFKAIYGVMSESGYSQDFIESIFYRGMYRLDSPAVQNHFYHMRFIYELQGVGLYDDKGEPITGTDFFIYNVPDSTEIYVRSTAQMINDELQKKHVGTPLKGINISKLSFGRNIEDIKKK